jgi:hypothetical protein
MTYPEGTGSERVAVAVGLAYWALHLIPAGFLLSALDPWPSGYYTALRIVVFVAALAIALHVYRRDAAVGPWVIAFGLTAVLLNPVLPIPIPNDAWATYIVIALLFMAHLIATRTPDGTGTLS